MIQVQEDEDIKTPPESFLIAAVLERAYLDLMSSEAKIRRQAAAWILDNPTLPSFSLKYTFEQIIDLLDIEERIWKQIRKIALEQMHLSTG